MEIAAALVDGTTAWAIADLAPKKNALEKALRLLPPDASAAVARDLFDQHLSDFLNADILAKSLLASHLLGVYAGQLTTDRESASAFAEIPMATLEDRNWYADALAAFRTKKIINGEEMQALLDTLTTFGRAPDSKALRQAVYDNSFTMVREGNAQIISNAGGVFDRMVKSGGTVSDFIHDLNDVYDGLGIGRQQYAYTELVYANNMNRVFNEGVQMVADEMDDDGILWGYEWIHSQKQHFRPAHKALDGFTAAKDDPRWEKIGSPPIGHGCGCRKRPVTYDEARRRGLVDKPKTPKVSGQEVRDVPNAPDLFTPGERSRGLDAIAALDKIPGSRFPQSEYNIPNRPLLNPSWGWKPKAKV